ncbi:hypothetical protein JR316_0000792 [Psilocybe cubensis]|uniref:Uncharacterized protein n=1 Tax=Psilocybe cubensis TaxID=181762 RepID=A0ACB8HGD0_PSICU|nr:hypothetical protein JR316_0000792 [Psilocybe cubensis]KAH9486727.1 hypothetical protein JR316_0000792 [Psilocybe cubensis]
MGRKSKRKEEDDDDDDDDDEVYHVGKSSSWEPPENLKSGCSRLLESFWTHVGTDDKDYLPGYVVEAKKDWIEQEKQYFRAESEKKLQTEPDKKKEKRKSKKRKRDKSSESSPSMSTNNAEEPFKAIEDSEDDRPLTETTKNNKIKIPQKSKKVILSPEPDETPPSPRPRKIRKKHSAGSNIDDRTEGSKSVPNSPKKSPPGSRPQSPTSLFSDRSSPEITLASTIQPRTRTTSVSVAKAKPRSTRKVTDPQAKIASMPESALVTSSGITTKQRIAQGALNPKAPKDLAPSQSTPKPLSRVPHLLNFKKISSSTDSATVTGVHSPSLESPSLHSPAHSPHSPHMLSGSFSSVAKQSNVSNSIVANQQVVLPQSRSFSTNSIMSPVTIPSPTAPMLEAENFLQSIMPSSLAAPLRPASEAPSGPMPPKAVVPKSSLPLPGRPPKLWSWSGPLYLTATSSSICEVKLQQQSPTQSKALGFSVAFQHIEEIQVSCFYDIANFRSNLGVFRNAPSQALVTWHEEKDKGKFGIFADYVEKAKKVFLLNITLDNNCVGQILFMAYAHGPFLFGMNLHPHYKQAKSLVAVALPYALSLDQLQLATKLPPSLISAGHSIDQTIFSQKKSVFAFEHGMRLLGFSSQLYSYIKEPSDRRYCIWSERPSGRSSALETYFLTMILEKTRAPRVHKQAEARLVFVHAEALSSLHKFPAFAERRAQHNYVQFYLYGSNSELGPYIPPVQEIYPCGGIVTFTPFAMRNDPLGVLQLIRKIDHHPLWSAYIVPSALGLLAKLECGQNDPLSELGKKPLMLDIILETIEEGQLSLLEALPEKPTVTKIVVQNKETRKEEVRYLHDREQWAKKYVSFAPPRQLAALEAGVRAFLQHKNLSAKSEGNAFMTVMDEITITDMAHMQRNPAFMSSHRRFVVIDSDKRTPPPQDPYVQGLEWIPLNKFSFKDDYYPNQSS